MARGLEELALHFSTSTLTLELSNFAFLVPSNPHHFTAHFVLLNHDDAYRPSHYLGFPAVLRGSSTGQHSRLWCKLASSTPCSESLTFANESLQKDCAFNAMPKNCGMDVACVCKNKAFFSEIACCIADKCNADEQKRKSTKSP